MEREIGSSNIKKRLFLASRKLKEKKREGKRFTLESY